MVKATSLQALAELAASGVALTQSETIYLRLAHNGIGLTRQELSQETGISINAICGRVSELMSKGKVKAGLVRACKITGKQAETLYSII